MTKSTLNKIANFIFYIACIIFIGTLTAVYYFNYFSIMIKEHIVYWVYLAPLIMVLYTLIKNSLFKEKSTDPESQRKSENTLEVNDKTS
ncbi:hypothetical protein [Facilibium subflavum]|uniref:hypothetical protein n=1 Tax=Facilibium subflavum TaxID=2219058 RepID=UPI000E65826F|nr:hypothetical protein [Facilibium subflavum]